MGVVRTHRPFVVAAGFGHIAGLAVAAGFDHIACLADVVVGHTVVGRNACLAAACMTVAGLVAVGCSAVACCTVAGRLVAAVPGSRIALDLGDLGMADLDLAGNRCSGKSGEVF